MAGPGDGSACDALLSVSFPAAETHHPHTSCREGVVLAVAKQPVGGAAGVGMQAGQLSGDL